MKTEALEVLKNRRSIRKYKDIQITDEELNAVLTAGTYAPTGAGTQGVQIIVVQSPDQIEVVNKLNAKILNNPAMTTPYYGAPTILLVLATEKSFTPDMDAAAVCTNMLNAAYAASLGSCWVHRCKEMFETDEGKKLLRQWGLPDNLKGYASIAIGYADCEHPIAPERKKNYIARV